ncbi:MAG: TOBE domain-containing protein, partial [Inhella sp.]
DNLVVMDRGELLQAGKPDALQARPRNARVCDLLGIQNRFHGLWLGAQGEPGWGLLRWGEGETALQLRVPDKGRIAAGRPVDWILPNDAVQLVALDEGWTVEVLEARHLGEISLITLRLELAGGQQLALTLSGAQRRALKVGERLGLRFALDQVHLMPQRGGGGGVGNEQALD